MIAKSVAILLLVPALTAAAGELSSELPRRLEFTVDEGTWMSVDIDPSGQTIVFDLLGDLYAMPASGGEATRIRGGVAYDAQPVYSPDGLRIAFISDQSGAENLWVAGSDGTNPRIVSDNTASDRFSSPAWAGDGQSVFVSRRQGRYGSFELRQYHLQGGSGISVGGDSGSELEQIGPAVSADGRYLYTAAKSSGPATRYITPTWHIARRDMTSGYTQQVVTASVAVFKPQLDPGGRFLSYAMRMDGETGVRLRDLVNGKDRWLAYPVQRDNADGTFNRDFLPDYTFTPDGKALIAAIDGKIQRIDISSGERSILPFTADVSLDLGPLSVQNYAAENGPVRARLIQHPAVSPDGKTLAFSAFARVFAADLSSGHVRQLTDGTHTAFQPSWSPDGRWISYVSWSAAGAGHVWRIRSSGGRARQLTGNAAYYSDPAFLADNDTVVALSSNNAERMRLQEEVTPRRFADLVRISVADGTTSIITHTGVGATAPQVSKDGNRVHFTTRDGVKSVLASARDGLGADERIHIRVEGLHPWSNPGQPYPVGSAKLSPDGNWILAISSGQVFVYRLPPASIEPPLVVLGEASQWPGAQVSELGADYVDWADDGRTIAWSLGATLFRRELVATTTDSATNSDPGDQSAIGLGPIEETAIKVEMPRDVPQSSLLMRGATVIAMDGGEPVPDADVLIVENKIAGVGPRGSVALPDGIEVRDVSGKFIVPGFVDTHAHWYEIRHGVLDLENWSFLANLAFGITSGVDVQAMNQDMFAYQDLIDAGLMIGPRAWSVGQGMFSNNRVESLDDARALIRRYTDYYRTRNIKSYLIGNREQRRWIAEAANEYGAIVTTEGNSDLKLNITHAIDGFAGNEHYLPVVPVYEDVVQLFAKSQISYTPTLMIVSENGAPAKNHYLISQAPHDDPKVRRFMPHFADDLRTSPVDWVRPEERMLPRVAESATNILRAGGRVGVGSHAEFQGLAFHWEMQALAEGGMTPTEILQAATIGGADIIGRADDVGSIEPGKFADLLILNSDPLADVRNTRDIALVMKNGRLYEDDTLDEIWPRNRKLPRPWHHEALPGQNTDRPH